MGWANMASESLSEEILGECGIWSKAGWILVQATPDYEYCGKAFSKVEKLEEYLIQCMQNPQGSWRIYGIYYNGNPVDWRYSIQIEYGKPRKEG